MKKNTRWKLAILLPALMASALSSCSCSRKMELITIGGPASDYVDGLKAIKPEAVNIIR
jgi:hypothetical protein